MQRTGIHDSATTGSDETQRWDPRKPVPGLGGTDLRFTRRFVRSVTYADIVAALADDHPTAAAALERLLESAPSGCSAYDRGFAHAVHLAAVHMLDAAMFSAIDIERGDVEVTR